MKLGFVLHSVRPPTRIPGLAFSILISISALCFGAEEPADALQPTNVISKATVLDKIEPLLSAHEGKVNDFSNAVTSLMKELDTITKSVTQIQTQIKKQGTSNETITLLVVLIRNTSLSLDERQIALSAVLATRSASTLTTSLDALIKQLIDSNTGLLKRSGDLLELKAKLKDAQKSLDGLISQNTAFPLGGDRLDAAKGQLTKAEDNLQSLICTLTAFAADQQLIAMDAIINASPADWTKIRKVFRDLKATITASACVFEAVTSTLPVLEDQINPSSTIPGDIGMVKSTSHDLLVAWNRFVDLPANSKLGSLVAIDDLKLDALKLNLLSDEIVKELMQGSNRDLKLMVLEKLAKDTDLDLITKFALSTDNPKDVRRAAEKVILEQGEFSIWQTLVSDAHREQEVRLAAIDAIVSAGLAKRDATKGEDYETSVAMIKDLLGSVTEPNIRRYLILALFRLFDRSVAPTN